MAKWMIVCVSVVGGLYCGADASVILPFADVGQRLAVHRATEGAALRLATPRCRLVLNDFTDAAGRKLAGSDTAVAMTIGRRLATLRFSDARGASACNGRTVAFTTPGARVVHVCGVRFLEMYEADSTSAEIIVIHELLHTLGLGENPPTSDAITKQVAKRCAP